MDILHISDVHFGVDDPLGEQRRITEALITAVHRDKLAPDLCIFSGDLAHSGHTSQFEAGLSWLRRLIRPQWDTRIVIVPGNHDTDRAIANKAFLRTSVSKNIYPKMRETLISTSKHMDSFCAFHRTAKQHKQLPLIGDWDTNRFGFLHTFETGPARTNTSFPVHVIGLNSSFMSCDDDDDFDNNESDNNLLIDIKTLNDNLDICNSCPGLILAISHHPFSHLSKWNSEYIERFLSQQTGAHLYFHGHLHNLSTTYTASNTGRRLTTIAAGAAYQGSAWPQIFSYMSLDFNDHCVTTKAYQYSTESGEWHQDHARSIAFRAELPTQHSSPRGLAPALPLNVEVGRDRTQDPHGHDDERTEESASHVSAYMRAAEDIQRRLLPYFRNAPEIIDYQYAFKSRTKAFERIQQKVRQRKAAASTTYDYSDLVDICGFRIITHYQSQIVKVISNMLHSIQHTSSIGGVPVSHSDIVVDINTSRPENDPLSISMALKDVCDTCGIDINVTNKSRVTGYSGVHFVFRVVFDPPFESTIYEMPVELQLRTALEDVWSELDTQLRFLTIRGELGPIWSKHLNVFKHIIDSLVQYADVIQLHSFDQPISSPSEVKRSRPVASVATQLHRLRGLPTEIYKRVEEAYVLSERATAARALGGDPMLRRQAAQAFISIAIEFAGDMPTDRHLESELQYVIEAESAFMLMYTGDNEDMAAAERSYLSILSKRKNDATANFRLGSLYRLKGMFDESISYTKAALDILDAGKDNRVSKHHWIYDRVRLGIALTEWKISGSIPVGSDVKNEHLLRALQMALDVARHPSEDQVVDNLFIIAINDLLYYYYELRAINFEGLGELVKDSEIDEYLNALYNYVLSAPECDYNMLDTALRLLSNDNKKAAEIADKLEQKFEEMAKFRRKLVGEAPPKRSDRWKTFVARNLKDDEEEDSFTYLLEILGRLSSSQNGHRDSRKA
jgi:ppGpp synthetase/RelA/SpoT-type nucleotidyltranferase/calcineurin-like phosphoesterase family protein